jgi:hypothetical protein
MLKNGRKKSDYHITITVATGIVKENTPCQQACPYYQLRLKTEQKCIKRTSYLVQAKSPRANRHHTSPQRQQGPLLALRAGVGTSRTAI